MEKPNFLGVKERTANGRALQRNLLAICITFVGVFVRHSSGSGPLQTQQCLNCVAPTLGGICTVGVGVDLRSVEHLARDQLDEPAVLTLL